MSWSEIRFYYPTEKVNNMCVKNKKNENEFCMLKGNNLDMFAKG